MNAPHAAGLALSFALLSAPAAWSGEQVCTMVEDCETGALCAPLSPPRTAFLLLGEAEAVLEMDGQRVTLSEVARFDHATAYAGTPSPNNALLLTLHVGGSMALTVHYVTESAQFSNTLRGTCRTEPV